MLFLNQCLHLPFKRIVRFNHSGNLNYIFDIYLVPTFTVKQTFKAFSILYPLKEKTKISNQAIVLNEPIKILVD